MDNLKTLEDFYDAFEYFLEAVALLKKEGNLRSRSPEQQKNKIIFWNIAMTALMALKL